MEVSIHRNELLSHLQRAQNIVERKSTLPILAHVLIQCLDDHLEISCTDLEVGAKELCQAKIIKEGSTTIQARKFYEIIREMPEGEVSLIQDGENLKIKCGRTLFRLRSLPPEEYPKIPAIQSTQSVKLPGSVLQEMIQKVMISISADEARYTLTGVLTQMEARDENAVLRMITTDGHRLSICERTLENTQCLEAFSALEADKGKPRDIILPKKGIQEIRRMMDEEASELEFGLFMENAFIRRDGFSMIMRLVQGKFPNFNAIIPDRTFTSLTLEAALLEECLRRVSVLSTEKSRGVRLSVQSGKMTVFSNSPELGEAEDELDISYKGESFEVAFNVRYLLDLLQVVKGELSLAFGEDFKPCLIREKADSDSLVVLMPLRT